MSKGECCAFFFRIAAVIHKGVCAAGDKLSIPGFRNFNGFPLSGADVRSSKAVHALSDVVHVRDPDAIGIKAGIRLPLDGYVIVFHGLILHKVDIVKDKVGFHRQYR